jgi:hypothetical protein
VILSSHARKWVDSSIWNCPWIFIDAHISILGCGNRIRNLVWRSWVLHFLIIYLLRHILWVQSLNLLLILNNVAL